MLISASILRGYKSICILKRAIFHTWVKINSVANGPNQSLICIPCEVLPGFFLFFFVNIYIQQLPLLLVNGMCSLHFCLLWDGLAGLSAYWKPFVVQTSLDCYNDDNAHLLWNKILNACLFFFHWRKHSVIMRKAISSCWMASRILFNGTSMFSSNKRFSYWWRNEAQPDLLFQWTQTLTYIVLVYKRKIMETFVHWSWSNLGDPAFQHGDAIVLF